jgi:hypothetical protein
LIHFFRLRHIDYHALSFAGFLIIDAIDISSYFRYYFDITPFAMLSFAISDIDIAILLRCRQLIDDITFIDIIIDMPAIDYRLRHFIDISLLSHFAAFIDISRYFQIAIIFSADRLNFTADY